MSSSAAAQHPTNGADNLLDQLIKDYDQRGPFLTHLPQFIYLAKYAIKQYQKKLPEFGLLVRPLLVGGAVDNTSGTLTAPDFDFNIEWNLNKDILQHLSIYPTDNGESGQYLVKIIEGQEKDLKREFRKIVVDIQNHGRSSMLEYMTDRVEDAYKVIDENTYLSSNLLRNQVGGLYALMEEGKSFGDFKKKDFSPTGAARTFSLDVKKFFRECMQICLPRISEKWVTLLNRLVEEYSKKLLPELDVDYTPALTVPYDCLPEDLKVWEQRDSCLLTLETRRRVKECGGCLVAKSLDKDENKSCIIWRLSINYAPVLETAVKRLKNCDVRKLLRLIKDIKQVSLQEEEKDFLKSYNVKQVLLWCVHEFKTFKSDESLMKNIFKKLIYFYKEGNLPSFLEPNRNLVYKMVTKGLLERAANKLEKILKNLPKYIEKVKERQESNRKEITDVRNLLSPMSLVLQFPYISEDISARIVKGLNKDLITQDGQLRFYYQDDIKVNVKDKKRDRIIEVGEEEALRAVSRNWMDSVLLYISEHDVDDKIYSDMNFNDDEIPSVNIGALEFVNCIGELFQHNKRSKKIKSVAAAVVPTLTDTLPEVDKALPGIVEVVQDFTPFVKGIESLLRRKK